VAADIRICFVGDSFVNGTGDETALGWPGRLCAAAARRGTPLTCYNLGVRRNTSRDILARWEREVGPRLPDSCDGRVVVSCGVNDTVIENGRTRIPPAESEANVGAILRGASRYRTILVGPPPVDDAEQNERIGALSRAYAHAAGQLGVPFIELFVPLAADRAYLQEITDGDGAHPGADGYAKMAGIIAASPAWWFPAH
jgi:lysophospholipase L1-like esterase